MTEHLDINLVAWPHNRAARRTLAKWLGYTQAAAEAAYKVQQESIDAKADAEIEAHVAADAEAALPAADFVGNRPPPVSVVVKDADKENIYMTPAGTLTKNRAEASLDSNGEPIYVGFSAVGRRVDGDPQLLSPDCQVGGPRRLNVQAAPDVQVNINGKPAEFATQWAASVEDLETVYMRDVHEGGKPVYLHAQNMGGLTFREDLAVKGPDGAPVRVGTLLTPGEVTTLQNEVSHALALREALRTQTDALEKTRGHALHAWSAVDEARAHMLRLAHFIDDLRGRRNEWRYCFSALVGGAAIAAVQSGHWYSLALVGGLLGYFGKQYWNDRKLDKLEPSTSTWNPGSPLTAAKAPPACTDDLCNCVKTPCDQPDVCGCDGFVADDAHMAGCGHAPSSPFNVPGVLPETPQVVVGDNKETK